jgi:DNA-binding transcriptional regulator YiaG
MTVPVTDAMRVRVIRAIIGVTSRQFCRMVGVSPTTLTSWEKGRAEPQRRKRVILAAICQQNSIAFLPNGMPVPHHHEEISHAQ